MKPEGSGKKSVNMISYILERLSVDQIWTLLSLLNERILVFLVT